MRSTIEGPLGLSSPSDPSNSSSLPRRRLRGDGLPGRFALIIVASALILIASSTYLSVGLLAGNPLRGLLATGCTGVGMALLVAAALPSRRIDVLLRSWPWLRRGALIVGLILATFTVLTFAGGVFYVLLRPIRQTYQSDVFIYTQLNVHALLAGKNPYTNDNAIFTAIRIFPHAYQTMVRHGVLAGTLDVPKYPQIRALALLYAAHPRLDSGALDPRTLHSYPALSFLLYAPYFMLGGSNIIIFNLAVYLFAFAWVIWITPVGWRHWGVLVALSEVTMLASSLESDNEIICLAFVVPAWHWRGRRWLSAALLGLGCAFKQYCWFFAPFYLLAVYSRYGWREALRRVLIVGAFFLAPNLPFLILSPQPWLSSLFLPVTAHMFAQGIGIIALSTHHLLPYGPTVLYAAMELGAFAVCLWLYWKYPTRIGDAALVLALVPLFFAYRSISQYFGFVPWLALYAASRVYAVRRRHLSDAERMRGSVYAGALALYGWARARLWGAPDPGGAESPAAEGVASGD